MRPRSNGQAAKRTGMAGTSSITGPRPHSHNLELSFLKDIPNPSEIPSQFDVQPTTSAGGINQGNL